MAHLSDIFAIVYVWELLECAAPGQVAISSADFKPDLRLVSAIASLIPAGIVFRNEEALNR